MCFGWLRGFVAIGMFAFAAVAGTERLAWWACERKSDCVVATRVCEAKAVNLAHRKDFDAWWTLELKNWRCGEVGPADAFDADCRGGQCTVVPGDALFRCKTAADCEVVDTGCFQRAVNRARVKDYVPQARLAEMAASCVHYQPKLRARCTNARCTTVGE